MALLTALGIVALAGVLTIAIYRLKFHPLASFPGPISARTTGLWQCYHVVKGDYYIAIREAHQKYGKFVRIGYNEVSICHKDAMRKILVRPLNKGNWYRIFAMPEPSQLNQMSRLNAKEFAILQKKIIRAYATENILQSEHRIDDTIKLFMSGIEQVATNEGSVDIDNWFKYFAFDIIGITTFSKAFGFLESGEDLHGCLATARKLVKYMAIMTYFHGLHAFLTTSLTPVLKWLDMEPMKDVLKTTATAIRGRKFQAETGLDMIAQWKTQNDDDPISDYDLLATANANVAAGVEGISASLQAVVYFILRNPRCEKVIREELSEAGDQGNIHFPIGYWTAQGLSYVQACIKETLRMHSVQSVGFPRISPPGGIQFDSVNIPSDVVVSVNPAATHLSPEIFGDDAHLFRPERWLEPGAATIEKYFTPFGKGYMTCPGQHLAHICMSKLVSTLFYNYDLAIEKPENSWIITETIVVAPGGWRLKLRRRNLVKI